MTWLIKQTVDILGGNEAMQYRMLEQLAAVENKGTFDVVR